MSRGWIRASTFWTPAWLLRPLRPLLSVRVEELGREDLRRLLEGLTDLNAIRVIPVASPGYALAIWLPSGGGLRHTMLVTAGLIEVMWLPCLMFVLGIARARMPRAVRPLMVPSLSRWCLTHAVEVSSLLAGALGLATILLRASL